ATVFLNQMRLLADHHLDGDGSRVDFEAHIMDSCNYTRNDPLTLLFFPFSIRYHALHHLSPSLSYHNLKPFTRAPRRLAAAGFPLLVARSTGLVVRCPTDALRTNRFFTFDQRCLTLLDSACVARTDWRQRRGPLPLRNHH
ncbi:MAG: fatty acid desaturase, partial [Planctomycetota bacterium]